MTNPAHVSNDKALGLDFGRPETSSAAKGQPVGRAERLDEIKQLTGLRGIAALAVAIGHFNIHDGFVLNWFSWGNLAVDVFFCLSAFTLSMVYRIGERAALPYRSYGVARVARIVPVYLVAVGLSAALVRLSRMYLLYAPGDFASDFVRQFLMINAWPMVGSGVFWNSPGWSLSVEAFCYIFIFPLLFAFSTQAMRVSVTNKAFIILAAALIDAIVFIGFYDPSLQGYGGAPRDWSFVHWVAIIRGLTMFVAGWLAYLAARQKDRVALYCGSIVDRMGVAILLLGSAHVIGLLNDHFIIALVPFFLMGLYMNSNAISSQFLSLTPVVWLGKISYSLYIFHALVQLLLFHFWRTVENSGDWFRLPISIVLSLTLAALSYYWLENPSRIFIRRVFGVRRPIGAADKAPVGG